MRNKHLWEQWLESQSQYTDDAKLTWVDWALMGFCALVLSGVIAGIAAGWIQ